ncbi:MAG: YhbY family RNA-binding protein [Desulfurococcales archaeon]|nr:YhbY family RNA-binding protein [Desulfurococcales archaeon]MCE4623007.1 YhbY family RNA-binding protein [Desulfurococcales archaeon]MCE4629254.1 YhbY family RNA-binding protein [Desulfurococcales archaeon]
MERIVDRVKKAHHDSPDVLIGKKGLTEDVLKEIDNRLKKKEVVKVKMLRTAVESGRARKEMAKKVASLLGARLMGVRGRTFVLYRPKKK